MSLDSIKETLQNFGLTKKETQIYLHIAKYGIQGGIEIANKTKTAQAVVYRTLKILQRKGFIESTLESPARFTAVPFEDILDTNIRARQQEAKQIENAKKQLLSDWCKINQGIQQLQTEKFTVIEGTQQIYSKIYQMVKQTKQKLNLIFSINDVIRADRFGITDAIINHPKKQKVKFQLITDTTHAEKNQIQLIKRKLKTGVDLRGRTPELGLDLSPRLVIKDDKEILFFTTPRSNKTTIKTDDTCLYTNCASLIQAFSNVFENLWVNSSDIEQKNDIIEKRRLSHSNNLFEDPRKAKNEYDRILTRAQNEIIIVTSPQGLINLSEEPVYFKNLAKNNISIKIMAPITEKNLKASQELLDFSTVKHVPLNYEEMTIIDKKHLFQFKQTSKKSTTDSLFFEDVFYTDDKEFIGKTITMLDNIWEKACIPSSTTIESIIIPKETQNQDMESSRSVMRNFRKVLTFEIEKENNPDRLTEKDVIDKIVKATISKTKRPKDIDMLFASTGQAIIHPPKYFNLPDIMLHAWHVDNHSSHGGNDSLVIHRWIDSYPNSGFIPSAIISNSLNGTRTLANIFAGTPAEKNTRLLSKDEFQVRVHGNTLFAVWTVPLVIKSPNLILPPCCLLLEGIGKVKTGRLSFLYKNGYKNKIEFNAFEALVTFYHPSSKYEGPGTDGIFFRDYVGEAYIPENH